MLEDQPELLGLFEDGQQGKADVLDQSDFPELEGVHEALVSRP